jgi:hypothetical protein
VLLRATTENVGLLGPEWPRLGTVGAADYPQAYGLIEGLSADVLHRSHRPGCRKNLQEKYPVILTIPATKPGLR